MNSRVLALLNTVVLAIMVTMVGLTAAPNAVAVTPDGATEDILLMEDGRELHGEILEETRTEVVFQLVDHKSGIRTKITFRMIDISEIKRDVAVAADVEASKPAARTPGRATSQPDDAERTFGALRRDSSNPDAPAFYIVPMKGQMGTDVNTDLYKEMLDDIRANDPDVLVIEMECADEEDMLYSMTGREEQGIADFDEYRELINFFRDELSDVRQVVWVHDSVGVSSVVAFVWKDMYMKPTARFGGLDVLQQLGFEKWADADVRGKMTAAFMSWIKGFLEYGGYSLVLADAMVRPQYALSGTWKGREVIWSLDTSGDYVVDQSDKRTAQFRAKDAEDLCLSDGTAETIDDLALLMGMREYRVCDGRGQQIFEDYREDWRRTFDRAFEWFRDAQEAMGNASGEDVLKYLGKAKSLYEKIIAAMDRYSAVELRLGQDYGIRRFDLVTQIELIKQQIRAIRQGQRGTGGGGRGGGPGGLGGGG